MITRLIRTRFTLDLGYIDDSPKPMIKPMTIVKADANSYYILVLDTYQEQGNCSFNYCYQQYLYC